MVLIPAGIATSLAGSIAGREIFNRTRKKSFEFFGYDFTRLFMLLVTYFLVAWIVEQYFRFLVLKDNAVGFIVSIIRFFNPDLPDFPPSAQEHISKLFVTGYNVGDTNLKYWDIIKAGAVLFVGYEWMQFQELSKSVGSTPTAMTHAVFGLIIVSLGLVTVPKFTNQLQKVIQR